MSLRKRLYDYLMSRGPEELIFLIGFSFAIGSILTLIFNLIGYVTILGIILYILFRFAKYQKRREKER